MTIEKLLECSAEQLEKMSNEELYEHFKRFLPVTRPELQKKPVEKTYRSNGLKNVPLDSETALRRLKAKQIAEQFGLKLKL